MTVHPALQALIDAKLAHAGEPQWALPIDQVRREFRAIWTPAVTGEPVAVDRIQDRMIAGEQVAIAARAYAPVRRPAPIIVYFHGGGYVKGGIEESDAFCRNLARTTQHVVVSIAYRLAPEHPFPAALDDALAAIRWTFAHAAELGGAPGPLVVCGESAGGNLAAVACVRLRGDPRAAIRHQVLLQPVVDFTLSFPSIAMSEASCLVPRDDLAWYYRTYCGRGCDPTDPRLSPMFAEHLAGLPAALIITAEHDTLRDEGEAYAKRLSAAGVATRYLCFEGMIHGFLQMRGLVGEAQAATEAIARALG